MGIFRWANSKVKNLHWTDMSLTKLSVAAFILMLAKLWNPILSLAWYWYAAIFVLAAIKPMYKVFKK
jgi:predicted membrane protein